MKKEAVLHCNTEEFVYPVARNSLVFRIRTAKKELKSCQIIYWNREDGIRKMQLMECYARDELFDYFQGNVIFRRVARYQKYIFLLEEINGEKWYYSAYGISSEEPKKGFFEYLYANGNDVVKGPKWAEGIIYYQIFPERFCNGDHSNDPPECEMWGCRPTRENYMGGDLAGICEKIDYLKELGVECLYLNPVFTGEFNHKYATTDYFKIDPIFGTNDEFKELVRKCHQNGIRIVLDGVFNHTGVKCRFFQDVLEKQEDSVYKNWFLIEKYPVEVSENSYECVGAYPFMPKLNTANPEVRDFILKVMDYWIDEYDIDGWRLDVADEVDSSIWEMARLVLKERHPDCILIGETWGYGGRLLRGSQLDSVMNYMFRDAIWEYFGKRSISEEIFDGRLNTMLGAYRSDTGFTLYNLIDSHDTERFLQICGENKQLLKMAAAFQILFTGSPAIYYGDEIGMTGGDDPDCRRCMIWNEQADKNLLEWYKKLISIRKRYQNIRRGKYRTIMADSEKNTFGFARYDDKETSSEKVYVIFHNSPKEAEIICPVLEDGDYVDILSKENAQYKAEMLTGTFYNQDITAYRAEISIKLEPYAVKVITKKKNGGKQNEERQKSTGDLTCSCDLLGGVDRMQ